MVDMDGDIFMHGGQTDDGLDDGLFVREPGAAEFEALEGGTSVGSITNHALVPVGGMVHILFGHTISGVTNNHFLYDPANDEARPVSSTGDQPLATEGHSATALPTGQILVFGGLDTERNFTSAASLITPSEDSPDEVVWTATTEFTGDGRVDHTAVEHDGLVYIFGGRTDNGPTNELWIYDTADHSWTEETSTPRPPSRTRHFAGIVFVDDEPFLVEGSGLGEGDIELTDVWRFNIEAGEWEEFGFMRTPRIDAAAARMFNGEFKNGNHPELLVFGGTSNGEFVDEDAEVLVFGDVDLGDTVVGPDGSGGEAGAEDSDDEGCQLVASGSTSLSSPALWLLALGASFWRTRRYVA